MQKNDRVFLITSGASVTMQNIIITGGATDTSGSGILVMENATLTTRNSTIIYNEGGFIGGGIYNDACYLGYDTVIASNTSNRGGGIAASGYTFLENCTITNNSASDGPGGGLYLSGSEMDVRASSIIGNTASTDGGGICTDSGGILRTWDFTVISGNTANDGAGGVQVGKLYFLA